MSVAVEKWVGEPIIVLKPDAQVSLQEMIDAWFRSVELAQTIETTPHRIVDLRSTSAPDTVVSLLRSVVMAMVGAPVEPALNVSFVGKAPAASLATRNCTESWFETLDDALNHIRTMAGVAPVSA